MAILAESGRITEAVVEEEIGRLRQSWGVISESDDAERLLGARADELDLFDRCQLHTVLRVCAKSTSMSQAGRSLFAVSRQAKRIANDADRLRKYLAQFGLNWRDVWTSGRNEFDV